MHDIYMDTDMLLTRCRVALQIVVSACGEQFLFYSFFFLWYQTQHSIKKNKYFVTLEKPLVESFQTLIPKAVVSID